MARKRFVFSEETRDKAIRLILRFLPILPGPELYDLVGSLRRSQEELDQQVEEAIAALQTTSELISKLEQGLKDRTERLEQLRAEYERYSELAEIEEEEIEALVKQLELTIDRSASKERWIALGINLVAGFVIFLLGIVLSDPVREFLDNLTRVLSQ